MENELKLFWNRYFNFNWKFGLFLILIVCIPRFVLVLYANESKNYTLIGLVMVISAIAPFIFLNKNGRRSIGLTPPGSLSWLLSAFVFGLLASALLHVVGKNLYDNSFQNWYQYIGLSLNRELGFVALAIPSMIFSPIGEELFFRGIVHSSFTKSFGEKKASVIDGSAFALTHISHFGLVFINNQWDIFVLPTILWVISMFLVSLLFIQLRRKTNSLLGSMFCHSGFNLGMVICIFYLL